jgi:hypothetical protein
MNSRQIPDDFQSCETFDRLNQKDLKLAFCAPQSIHQCIKNLSKLSLDLYEHAELIPPVPGYVSCSSAQPSGAGENTIEAMSDSTQVLLTEVQETREFPIDATFHLITALVDIISYLNAVNTPKHHELSSDIMATGHPYTRARHGEARSDEITFDKVSDAVPAPNCRPVDYATITHVVSCYNRLMDIYECLFGHIKTCIERSVPPISSDGRPFSLPAVRIGTYQVPETKAIRLQVMTLLQMSASVGEGIQSLLDKVQAAAINSEGDEGSCCHDMACTDVRYRAIHVATQIGLTWKDFVSTRPLVDW